MKCGGFAGKHFSPIQFFWLQRARPCPKLTCSGSKVSNSYIFPLIRNIKIEESNLLTKMAEVGSSGFQTKCNLPIFQLSKDLAPSTIKSINDTKTVLALNFKKILLTQFAPYTATKLRLKSKYKSDIYRNICFSLLRGVGEPTICTIWPCQIMTQQNEPSSYSDRRISMS